MLRVLTITLLCLSPLGASAQVSSELSALEKRITLLQAHRGRLEKLHAGQVTRISRLKSSPAGVGRDFQLNRALRENRVLAGKLTRLQDQIRGLNQKLLSLYDRAIASSRETKEREVLSQRRATLAGRLSRPATRIVTDERASPLDSPEDLEEKADLLRDSEEKVRRQIQSIQRQIALLKHRLRLKRHSRAVDDTPFVEDSPRRVARARSSSSSIAADQANSPGRSTVDDNSPAEGKSGGSPPPAPSGAFNSEGDSSQDMDSSMEPSPGDEGPLPATPLLPGGGGVVTHLIGDLNLTMRNVLDPSIIKELEKAGKSGDLKARIEALTKARQRLLQMADKLGSRAKSLDKRAKTRQVGK